MFNEKIMFNATQTSCLLVIFSRWLLFKKSELNVQMALRYHVCYSISSYE
jgi:hypothetical protein